MINWWWLRHTRRTFNFFLRMPTSVIARTFLWFQTTNLCPLVLTSSLPASLRRVRPVSKTVSFTWVSIFIQLIWNHTYELVSLILVTQRRVSSATLKMWRPSIASQKPLSNQGSVDEDSDGSMDDVEDETPSPISGPAPFPLSQPLRHRDRSEEEVEQDIVSILSISGK